MKVSWQALSWYVLPYHLVVKLKRGCRKNGPVLLRKMSDYTTLKMKYNFEQLTEADFNALTQVANVKMKALLGLLKDTGARLAEVSNLRKADLEKTEFGYWVTIKDNMTVRGYTRIVPVTKHIQHIEAWINEHPTWDTEENPPLFCRTRNVKGYKAKDGGHRLGIKIGDPLQSATIGHVVARLREKAGITKNITTYSFRMAKRYDLEKMGLHPRQFKHFLGLNVEHDPQLKPLTLKVDYPQLFKP